MNSLKFIENCVGKNCNPIFKIEPKNIEFLYEPHQYYNSLIELTKSAQERLVFSSLYLGSGSLEESLVNTIDKQLEIKPNLKFYCYLDHGRGLRTKFNSVSMLTPLVYKYPCRCYIYLCQSGYIWKYIMNRYIKVPPILNEILSVYHIKAYFNDNQLLFTGANLSEEYFVNRTDRYFLINNQSNICSFLHKMLQIFDEFSTVIKAENGLITTINPTMINLKSKYNQLESLLKSQSEKGEINCKADTYLALILNENPIGLCFERYYIQNILKCLSSKDKLILSTAYYNIPDEIIQKVCEYDINIQIYTSNIYNNSFMKSEYPKKFIPLLYSYFLRKHYEIIEKLGKSTIEFYEYSKESSTFHSKGIWIYNNYLKDNRPCASIIGSSNYNQRSVHRDTELNLLLVTKDDVLRSAMQKEVVNIQKFSNQLTNSHSKGHNHFVEYMYYLGSKFLKKFL